MWAAGPDHPFKLQLAFCCTLFFVSDIERAIPAHKSFIASSAAAARQWLRAHLWPIVSTVIPILLHFRDSGSHVVEAGGARNLTHSATVRATMPMCCRFRAASPPLHDKLLGARMKALPKALHGREAGPTLEVPLVTLRARLLGVFFLTLMPDRVSRGRLLLLRRVLARQRDDLRSAMHDILLRSASYTM